MCTDRTNLRVNFLYFFIVALFQLDFYLPCQIPVSAKVTDGRNVSLPAHLLTLHRHNGREAFPRPTLYCCHSEFRKPRETIMALSIRLFGMGGK